MEFKERLQEARKEKGISQKKLADEMATTQQTISKWELGILQPSYDDLKKLCKLFNITSDYLLGLED